MKKSNKFLFVRFVLIGIVFHSLYLYSIIDIYFQSPLIPVKNQYQIPNEIERVAKRMFFLVFDGATSDDFFPYGAPNLREKYIDPGKSVWGISHTRVPTESRPGHVAMFGGFYEDPSSVTTGWSVNPVAYDSVIEQAKYSLLIGASDVVGLFEHLENTDVYSFPMEMEDFSSEDPNYLDRWVENKFFELIASNEGGIVEKLKQDEVFVFLHFEGIDCAGHEFRPGTEGYRKTIRWVDEAVDRIVDWVEEFYEHDGKTSYLATSDHGMSVLGTHGGAEYGCTRTPFVAWGAGIPLYEMNDEGHRIVTPDIIPDGRFDTEESEIEHMIREWKMDRDVAMRRKDLRQGDIAPLVASLLGIHYPVNSVGILPTSYCCSYNEEERRREDKEFLINALFSNSEQINEQFREFERLKKEEISIGFVPFIQQHSPDEDALKLVRIDHHTSSSDLRISRERMESMLSTGGREDEIIESLKSFIGWNLDGIRYYQQYHKYFLLVLISSGYVLYIVYLFLISSTSASSTTNDQRSSVPPLWLIITTCTTYVLFSIYLNQQHSSYTVYVYSIFPFFFACISYPKIITFAKTNKSLLFSAELRKNLFQFLFSLLFVEIMCIGFFERWVFAVGYILLSLIHRSWWCLSMTCFSILPLGMGNQVWLMCIGVGLNLLLLYFWFFRNKKRKATGIFFLVSNLLSFGNLMIIEFTIGEIPVIYKFLSWTLLVVSLLSPFFIPTSSSRNKNTTGDSEYYEERYKIIFFSFTIVYTLLSINVEMIFFTFFAVTLHEWIFDRKSTKINQQQRRKISNNLLFLYFFFSSFFATGNLASFSSFQLSSVYRFLTTLRPFTMTFLLVLKLMIPFLMTIMGRIIKHRLGTDSEKSSSFLVSCLYEIVALCDMMSLTFLFLVRDVGSWLEIGNSISRFALTNLMMILMLVMYCLALVYVKDVRSKEKKCK